MKVFGFLESKPCRQAFSAVVLYLTKKFKLLEKTLFVAFVVKLVKSLSSNIGLTLRVGSTQRIQF